MVCAPQEEGQPVPGLHSSAGCARIVWPDKAGTAGCALELLGTFPWQVLEGFLFGISCDTPSLCTKSSGKGLTSEMGDKNGSVEIRQRMK